MSGPKLGAMYGNESRSPRRYRIQAFAVPPGAGRCCSFCDVVPACEGLQIDGSPGTTLTLCGDCLDRMVQVRAAALLESATGDA